MSDMYMGVILLAVTALLLCWVVAEFQIYSADHSMEEAIRKPRAAAEESVEEDGTFSGHSKKCRTFAAGKIKRKK